MIYQSSNVKASKENQLNLILHQIDHETINIPEIFSGVHFFMGRTVTGHYTC